MPPASLVSCARKPPKSRPLCSPKPCDRKRIAITWQRETFVAAAPLRASHSAASHRIVLHVCSVAAADGRDSRRNNNNTNSRNNRKHRERERVSTGAIGLRSAASIGKRRLQLELELRKPRLHSKARQAGHDLNEASGMGQTSGPISRQAGRQRERRRRR